MKNVAGFGLLYMGILFVISLYKELFGDKKAIEESKQKGSIRLFREINGGKDPWLVLTLYALFFGLFLGQLFQVIYPIVKNLCIYKSI